MAEILVGVLKASTELQAGRLSGYAFWANVGSDLMIGHSDIATFLRLFRGREDYLAHQGDDYYYPVHSALDPFHVQRHLLGDATFGVYVLNEESKCNFVCVDIDIPKEQLDALMSRDRAAKYERLSPFLQQLLRILEGDLGIPTSGLLLEETGGRGYHVWIFLAAPSAGDTAVAFGRALKSRLAFDIEFFPKQGSLSSKRKFGNLIKLPLGIHQKYGQRSVFFSIVDGKPHYVDGIEENLALLGSVLPVDPALLERAGAGYHADAALDDDSGFGGHVVEVRRLMFAGSVNQLLANCTAMRMIGEKASAGQSLSHSEAFHYANVMLSLPEGERWVHEAMMASFGDGYDEERTRSEIARIRPLWPTSCRTLVDQRFCPEYCKKTVAERNRDPLVSNTSPCSVWLRRDRAAAIPITGDTLQAMANPETVQRSFFRLKQYHEHEDSLFYDPFDFELFAAGLGAKSQVVAKAFDERMDIPLAGYLPVRIPKRLDGDLKLRYRQMSYSTVFDQVPIQTAFDVIAAAVEATLQPCSYGYRWNIDDRAPSRIFEDWREAYPRFSGGIMSAIQENPMGYHVCCDIKGYYDHVDHAILLEQLRLVALDDYVRRFIERIIRTYEAEPGSGKGLPQGPAYARLLANLYLNDFDSAAQEIATSYFRYVDDFFLVFYSSESAERGLEKVVAALRRLGLELSDDEKKRPIIEPNTDVSNIRRALDKIQYGILEGARQIQHLDPETVSDFYSAVERHSGSPADLEQLIRINDALPSLLYAVSQKILVPHEFRTKLLEIARLLIKRGWFCPKRLKTVFYRLLEIEPNKSRFADLFDAMEPAHRVYFLLTEYGCWCSRREHEDLLEVLLAKARQDVDPFVWGFAIAMSAKMGTDRVAGESIASATGLFPPRAGWFALSRLLGSHDYGSLSADQRDVIRRSLTEKSADFVKALMLVNLRSLPATYLDGTYLRGLLSEFRFMLVPPTSRLLAMASDRSEVFDAIVDFMISKPSFKSICVSLVTQALREKRASAGRTDIMNLQSLYVHVHDAELRKAMLDVLASIDALTLDTDGDFAKTHKQVANYNGCYLFQRIWGTGDYQYLELIPEDRLRESCRGNFDSTKRILADLSSKGVLPPHEFSYDSGKREVTLRLDPRQDTVELSRGGLTLDPATIAEALCLAADAFKKATYFHRMTGKVPLVTLQNLLFGRRDGNVVFRTVGRSLKTPLVVSGVTIGEEDTDIARMVGLLLQEFFFVSAVDAMEFLKKGHHPASSAFLAQMIGGMSSKEPKHRYSSLRFQYLATAFSHSQARSDKEVAVLYLLERLKAELFRNNSEHISWDGVCSALNGHIADVRVLLDKRRLSAAPLQNRTVGYTATNGKLHLLSLQMLNLSMNRHRIPILRSADPAYLDLVEYLLLYAALCVEVVSLCRAAWGRGLVDVEKYHSLLAGSEVVIEACQYTQTFPSSDLAALFTYRRDGTGTGIRDLSLRQVALLALLACGEERVEVDHLYIERSHGFPAESFDDLAHACLSRIPRAEAGVHCHVKAVLSALRTGDDLAPTTDLGSLREALDVVAHDFTRLRRRMKIKRYRGWADGKKFPEKIVCRRKFRRPVTAELDAIPSMALVNIIPSSQYQCSWDMCEGVVTNLVVPSSGAYSLLKDLRKGKFFGRKLSYLYSGRAMLLWDVALFAASLLLMILLKCGEAGSQNTLLKSFCAAGFEISTGIALFLVSKVLYDLRHWFPQIDAAIVHLRRVSTKDRIREDDNESSRCDV